MLPRHSSPFVEVRYESPFVVVSRHMRALHHLWEGVQVVVPLCEMPWLALPTFIGAYYTDGDSVWYEGRRV